LKLIGNTYAIPPMIQSKDNIPAVSVVVIGRNEAKYLRDCIQSILDMNYPQDLIELIYVDTGSTDDSQTIARSMGVIVFEEVSDHPTPALARNRGLKEAKNDIIHFVDGDTIIYPNYLRDAVGYLNDGQTACVFGKLKEKDEGKNWISDVLSTEWKVKQVGYIDSPGCGGTFIKAALDKVGGYNSQASIAEETDLGIRLRQEGYAIRLIDSNMCIHDYGVNNILGLIYIYFRNGKARGKLYLMQNMPWEIRKISLKLLIQGLVMLLAMVLFIITGYVALIVILCCIGPILLFPYIYFKRHLILSKNKIGISGFIYYYLDTFMKPVVLTGIINALLRR